VREVRIPKWNRYGHTAAGWFDDPEKVARAAIRWDGKANLYVTVNPVDPSLLGRASNRIAERMNSTTNDLDIIRRDWLFVDIDAVRPPGISSTDAELAAAWDVTAAVRAYLDGLDWPAPITAMSGNGWYLLYGIDLPNDAASTALVKRVLEGLAARFDTPAAHVDTTTSNASRIMGLVGTLKVKGDPLPDRPHRRSQVVHHDA